MSVPKDDSMEVHYIGSYRMHPDRSSYLGSSANGLMVWQIHEDSCLAFCKKQEFVWPHLNCMDGSVLAFLNCTDGSVVAFLNCTDGSLLTHLNGSYGSVLSHLRFPTPSGLTRFTESGISLVPWLLCKKSNKKTVFEIEWYILVTCLLSILKKITQVSDFQNGKWKSYLLDFFDWKILLGAIYLYP